MKKQSNPNYYWENADSLGWGPKQKMANYKIAELLDLVAGPRILDVGCGPGHWVDVLSGFGFECVGLDSESRFIEYANNNYKGKFVLGKAEKLPFKDKEFDTVFVRSVLEHVENDRLVLSEALRVGKKVVVVVPQTVPAKLIKSGLIYSHYADKTHLRSYTQKSLRKLIESCEAEVVEIREIERLPVRSIVYEVTRGMSLLKRIGVNLWFFVFREEKLFLELLAIIKTC